MGWCSGGEMWDSALVGWCSGGEVWVGAGGEVWVGALVVRCGLVLWW